MSKSDPDSAIFMEDTEAEIISKIKKAYCPPEVIEGNPVIDYVKCIIFEAHGKLQILRKKENGGDKLYLNFEELKKDYVNGLLNPGDLKPAVSKCLNSMIEPVRTHFANDPYAK